MDHVFKVCRTNKVGLLSPGILFLDGFLSLLLFRLIHSRPCSLFDHGKNLRGLHVEHLEEVQVLKAAVLERDLRP